LSRVVDISSYMHEFFDSREFIILLVSFGVMGIRFIFEEILGIASVRYFVASSVVKVVVSLFILSTIVKK
jgi:hypothetical protein